ncbi:uncharacterized protein [Glycine max]|uniref:uncharacterized protein n=1 Tax=Glycine max TaxID=3847 RepID=UPI0003DEA0B8|nr:uncharacterized protein LOC102666635 [Glycine max]|eukprot:XP_006591621.1 uncharacterized protein LOC102666635 [Glycine max]
MATSDHAILRDRTHIPTKRSLLELSSQDALLAQNKGCSICEGAHESGRYIPLDDTTQENQGQWRSHPENQFNKDQGGSSNRPQNQGPSLYDRTTQLEETLAQFMSVTMSNHKSIESAIKNLEIQVGQLAKQIAENSSSNFGANTKKNPNEECKAIMTRSRKANLDEDEGRISDDQELITIPFGETLQQMPLYYKFLKDLLTRKNKYIHSDNIVVEGNCSAMIQRILPPKHNDPGGQRIGEMEIMPTRMTLQLADRSITRSYGVIEDVLVKVQQFTFPADFVVMDIEEDFEIPLILGRPFMLTADCVVDMGKGKLEMCIDDQKIKFDLFDAENHLLDPNVCLKVEEIKNEMVLMARAKLAPDP